MDSFPQELIDRISSYLTNADLKHTLCLNRAFNQAAERSSGTFTSILLNENCLQDRWVLTQTTLCMTNTWKNMVVLTIILLGGGVQSYSQ